MTPPRTAASLVLVAAAAALAAAGEPDAAAAARAGSASPDGSFYGLEVRETNVVFLLDCSASMRGKRIDTLRAEFAAALAGFDDTRRFVVIPFGGPDMTMFPATGLEPATRTRREQAVRFLERRRAEGRTPMLQALKKVFTHLVRRQGPGKPPVEAIYLLSDGAATDATADRLLDELDDLDRDTRLAIHTVSIGTESDLLRDLARRHGGRYRAAVE